MMWDFSGGRRSPVPPTGPAPSFPVPHHRAPSSAPASNSATIGSGYPTLASFGNSAPSTSRTDSFGFNYDSSYEHQTSRGQVSFPASSPYYPTPSPGTLVIQHSKHHSKSKSSSRNRLRRHSHSNGQAQAVVVRPTVPQVPIYHSSGQAFSPAHVHHSTSSHNLNAGYTRRPSVTHPEYVPLQKPSSSSRPNTHSGSSRPPKEPYSTCRGLGRKALCIGINYTGQRNELRGCVNDAQRVRKFLMKNGYRSEDIVLLTDDTSDPRELPTRANIVAAMKWLVRGAQPNDALFFHYSGHGGQTKDLNGDEIDGYDEVIFPLDFKRNGHITDDEMHEIMAMPLPPNCRLTGLFDACHSGTVLDLPYIYSSRGRLKGSHVSDRARRKKKIQGDVISWSGCRDDQTSADTFHGGVAVGAMSHAFISALTTNPDQTYHELLLSIRRILHPRYSQKPQLGSSHRIATDLKFVF